MARLEVRLDGGLLYFYLAGTKLFDGVRLEYLGPSGRFLGRFHTRPDPFGAELVLDKPHRGDFLRLTETSDLRRLTPPPLFTSASEEYRLPSNSPDTPSSLTLKVSLKRGELSLRLGNRNLSFGVPLLLRRPGRWVPGTLRYRPHPARIVLQSSNREVRRITPTSELRFPSRSRSSEIKPRQIT
jgi:hypothetical protein